MPRIHGRAGVAYLGLNSGDAAGPVAFLSDWTIAFTETMFDVTAIPDIQHIYAAGTYGTNGTFTGFFDTATAQTYAAAVDGLPRNMYLYPGGVTGGAFFAGTVLPDYNITGGVTAAVALSVAWTGVVARFTSGLVTAGLAAATGTALGVTTGNVNAPAGLPSASGAAVGSAVTVNANAGTAAATGAALNATVSTGGNTNANAGLAAATGAVAADTVTVSPHPAAPTASGWAAVNNWGVYSSTYHATYP